MKCISMSSGQRCPDERAWSVALLGHDYKAMHDPAEALFCRTHATAVAADLNQRAREQAHEPRDLRPDRRAEA